MHPADQYERFRELAEARGWGAEEIAARFGVTAHVVRQRLRLGAVSPKLMQVYRDGGLSLDQLMAFAITEDHDRQEQVFGNLSYNREPWIIRRDLTKTNVEASDRRAIFVGADAYTEAGGTIIRDLFTEDRGGYFEDAALLDLLVIAGLEEVAAEVQAAEGWKWSSVHIDYPHAHGLHRSYPHPVELSEEDAAAYDAAQEELESLSTEWQDADVDLPDEVDQRLAELEAEIERIDAKRHAYDADEIARGGVFVILNHDGTARIERGFIRAEDEVPEPEDADSAAYDVDGVIVTEDGEIVGDAGNGEDADVEPQTEDEDAGDAGKPLSDLLIRDLTAHRTLGLRLALGEQPDMALIAVVHALAAQTFYRGGEASCLEIRLTSAYLASHADGIEDTPAAKALADRHAGWASDMPRDVADLWAFVAGLDQASLMALLAHCASLTVNAVRVQWEQKPQARATTEKLASAVTLDMTTHWTPTEKTYLGRVTKAHILAAVRDGVGNDAAERIADLKKADMAQAAEQLLAGTGWLPSVLRTTQPAWLDAASEADTYLEAAERGPGRGRASGPGLLAIRHPKNRVARGSTPRDRSDDRHGHRVQEDHSMIVLMLMAVALVVGLSVLAYTLAVYALPFMLGVEAAKWAYASGSGLIGAGLVGLVAGTAAYVLLVVLFTVVRSPILRLAVVVIFAAPAAVAGFALVHGVTREAVPSEIWRVIFCLIGGGVTGSSALMRLAGTSSPSHRGD